MKHLLLLLILYVVTVLADDDSTGYVVNAPIGRIRGSTLNSRLGKTIYSFRGVRYAEPPTGQQRFQPPIPAADWNDIFDATEEGPSCPALEGKNISEDCLSLNVYTTKLPSTDVKSNFAKRPVLVFFHPGGFYVFSSQSIYFGPQYIMDKDIILVTVNYRLASLGFLSTGDSKIPGNMGLKDQVMALRWVQRNIAAFGGDPNSVTISGYSVGGLSVMMHMVSPMSTGLFHRAIMMSGSTMIEPFPNHQIHLAKKQAELLGCPTDTTGAMLVCLNSKPVEDYTDTIIKFFEWNGDPIVIWTPVVEPEVHGVERFLPEQPLDLIRKGKFNKVPLIAGVTKDEFGGVVVEATESHQLGNDSLFDNLNERWYELAPISFLYERNTPRSRCISKELRDFYFGNQEVGPNTYDGLAHIYADSVIIFPMYRVTKLIAQHSNQPVYSYMFSYQGRRSFAMWNDTTPYGVVHHDDLQYLFFISAVFPFLEDDAPEIPMLELMTTMWSNFVQVGQPVLPMGPTENITWDPYVTGRDNYLEISQESKMKTRLYRERMQKWESLFPVDANQSCRRTSLRPDNPCCQRSKRRILHWNHKTRTWITLDR